MVFLLKFFPFFLFQSEYIFFLTCILTYLLNSPPFSAVKVCHLITKYKKCDEHRAMAAAETKADAVSICCAAQFHFVL